VNTIHLELCASPEWAQYVRDDLLPWAMSEWRLGDDVLELGPGPGLSTDVLREHVARLTALELDEELFEPLHKRLQGTNVSVLRGDATNTGLPSQTFSAVTCFTMLHHVPTPELQDALFAEAHRVLQPGGIFLGTDGIDTEDMRALHVDDIFMPVDPDTFPVRLAAAGFADISVDVREQGLRFAALRPR
jgi:ubiquinone/menaquinone biosynthesis C-methylase UbiE